MGVIQILGDSTKQAGNFELKQEGYYTIRILEVTEHASEGKAPGVRIAAEILGGPAHIGEQVSSYMTLAEWNAGNWRALCDNCQPPVPYTLVPTPDGKEGISLDTDHLPQRLLGIKIVHKAGKGSNAGKTFENWAEYISPQALNVAPAQPSPAAPQGYAPPQGYQPPVAQHQAGQGAPPPVVTQYNPNPTNNGGR
jgi:hypothetical protein